MNLRERDRIYVIGNSKKSKNCCAVKVDTFSKFGLGKWEISLMFIFKVWFWERAE